MKQFIILIITFLLSPFLIVGVSVRAQTPSLTDNHTAREEVEGKEIWGKLQTKQLECKNLTDDNYGSLGEYFMGQMIGSSHGAMNNMMVQMMGEQGEKQMHVVMGKRLSGCDTNAQFSQNRVGFVPMMGSGWGNMMGWGGGFSIVGLITVLVLWLLLILSVIALIRYLSGSGKRGYEDKSSLDILKGRYARGEISKKEFEEMKKDLR